MCEILGLFFNTLTAKDSFSLRKSENLLQQTQMELSEKQIFFSNPLVLFFNLSQILNILKKKTTFILRIFEVTNCERRCSINV